MAESKEQPTKESRWFALAGRLIGVLALAVLFLVPATALIGGGVGKDHSPAFLVAWGGDGGLPAVALVNALSESAEEAVVLLPGCSTAGSALRTSLQNDGVAMLAGVFLPTGAPYPKGAKALLKGLEVRRIVVAEDSRSRGDWQSVIQDAVETGTAMERLQPQEGRQWTTEFDGWTFVYRRLPGGENEGELYRGKNGCHFFFRNLESGEFLLERQEGEVTTQLLELPRINHNGVKRIPMGK